MDFFNKFSNNDKEEAEKRAEEHRHQEELDASRVHPAAEHERKSSNSFLDKLTGREEQHESPEVENKKYHEEAEHEKHNFLDRITGKAEREEAEERRRREIEERERELERLRREEEERNKNVFEKLGDKFSGHHIDDKEREESSEHHKEKAEDPSFFDKITGKAAREEEERRRREEEERNKSTWDKMGDKFNEKLGGGRKAEQEEDKLDKGIDFVQEHILKQGPQDDESAFEQRKDKMIADAIRSGYKSSTGHEFFLKEKKEKEEEEEKEKKHHWGL
ncbi:uncharacterized protein BKA78DRAFT_78882 [Phyllosticta capitalensis]|uniref:uncharacterized protein n=1 Tax=Phyllosticta capitalensis TaxID=121624 RepID=UPI00312EAE4E